MVTKQGDIHNIAHEYLRGGRWRGVFTVIDRALSLIDRVSGLWLDWRSGMYIKQSKLAQDLGLKSFEAGRTSNDPAWELVVSHPVVALMADELSSFLTDAGVKNYVQFDMLPRLDRGLSPVRVTIQWADGMSPAEKAGQLEEENDKYKSALWSLYGSAVNHIYMLQSLTPQKYAGRENLLAHILGHSCDLYSATERALMTLLEVDHGSDDMG